MLINGCTILPKNYNEDLISFQISQNGAFDLEHSPEPFSIVDELLIIKRISKQ